MKNKVAKERKKRKSKIQLSDQWEKVNHDAAGIDIGARDHYVCIPADRDPEPVRRFGTTTAELEQMAEWMQQRRIKTAAMEATGVYWIATFQILEKKGLKMVLVNPRQGKNVSGRNSAVVDC